MKSKTDWNKLKSMTDKEIANNANSDPDAKPVSTNQLNKFKRTPNRPNKETRNTLKSSAKSKRVKKFDSIDELFKDLNS